MGVIQQDMYGLSMMGVAYSVMGVVYSMMGVVYSMMGVVYLHNTQQVVGYWAVHTQSAAGQQMIY